MTDSYLEATDDLGEQLDRLDVKLAEAQQALLEAEAELAQEQAAVNAFRMHCRLKLDSWINTLLELQTEKQSLMTELQLLRQAQEYGIPYDSEDPFWQSEGYIDHEFEERAREEELLLPTDTPRDKAAEKRLYRQLVRRFHPDLGVTAVEIAYRTEIMAAVNNAYEAQNIQALYDLADELDPDVAARLSKIPGEKIRSIQRTIIRLGQRRRKARRRLASLRQENTARLWRKAQRLEDGDTHWWEIVRREIELATNRVRQEIDHVRSLIMALEQEPESPDTH